MSIALERILSTIDTLQISPDSAGIVKAVCDNAADLHSKKANGRLVARPSGSEKLTQAILAILDSGLGSFVIRKRLKNLIREIYLSGDFDMFLEHNESHTNRIT